MARSKPLRFRVLLPKPLFRRVNPIPLGRGVVSHRFPGPTVYRLPVLSFRVVELFNWRAGAEQVSIAINIVDPGDAGPELVIAQPWCRKGRLSARVRMFPFFGSNLRGRVRSVF